MTDTPNTQAQDAPAAGSPDNVVTLTDLQNVLVVIDLASSRGAYRGPELEPVGLLYNKINRFLASVLPPPQQETESSTTEVEGSEITSAGAAN